MQATSLELHFQPRLDWQTGECLGKYLANIVTFCQPVWDATALKGDRGAPPRTEGAPLAKYFLL